MQRQGPRTSRGRRNEGSDWRPGRVTHKCSGRQPGRSRRTAACSSDRSRHAGARGRVRGRPIRRWRTSSRRWPRRTWRTAGLLVLASFGPLPRRPPLGAASASMLGDDPPQRQQRPGHEDQRGQVDEPQVAQSVDPQLPTSDAIGDQEQHRQPGGGDEAGHRDVQVADVVEQARAELLDGVLAHGALVGADAQLQESRR
jgi:hypothetical protein